MTDDQKLLEALADAILDAPDIEDDVEYHAHGVIENLKKQGYEITNPVAATVPMTVLEALGKAVLVGIVKIQPPVGDGTGPQCLEWGDCQSIAEMIPEHILECLQKLGYEITKPVELEQCGWHLIDHPDDFAPMGKWHSPENDPAWEPVFRRVTK